MPSAAETIAAIRRVAGVASRFAIESESVGPEQADVIRHVASRVHEAGGRRARELVEIIRSRALQPIEPRNLQWNVFELLGQDSSERAWTAWIGALLDSRHGERLAALCWRALCRSASDALVRKKSAAKDEKDRWSNLARKPPTGIEVHREDPYPGKGTPDLFIATHDFVILLENKLWEDWHDWSDSRQADRYRDVASAKAAGREQLLVLLSAREDLAYGEGKLKVPSDYVWISYADLARALRWELDRITISYETVLDWWPALITVTAIERCILDITVPSADQAGWQDLECLEQALSLMPKQSLKENSMPQAGFDEIGLAYAQNLKAIEGARALYEQQRDTIADQMLARMRDAMPKPTMVLDVYDKEKQPYRELYLDGPYAKFRARIAPGSKESEQAGLGFVFDAWNLFDARKYGLSTYLFFRMESASWEAIRAKVGDLIRREGRELKMEYGQGYLNIRVEFIEPASDRFQPDVLEEAAARLPTLFRKLEQPILDLYKAVQESD